MELLKTFHLVATLKSMARAAEQLNVKRSTITKHIQQLEYRIGNVKLMDRSTRGIHLTEAGKLYFEWVDKIILEAVDIKAQLKDPLNSEKGAFRLLAIPSFGIKWFSQFVKEFLSHYPNISLEIIYSNLRTLELSSANNGVYAGLTTTEPSPNTAYIWKHLGKFHIYPYVHPAYLKECGIPLKFGDLDKHRLIGATYQKREFSYITEKQLNCLLYLGKNEGYRREPILTTDDALSCRELIEKGAGIGLLPEYVAAGSELVKILPNYYEGTMGGTYNAYFVYPPHLKDFKRLQIVRDYILGKIKESCLFNA